MTIQTRSPAIPPTRVAVLGTLAEFHREPIPYDLAALVRLVSELHPDLLCLDMTLEQWQRQDFGDLPPEYRDALLPLAYQTDMVVVPIAEDRPPAEPATPGWRGWLINFCRRGLASIQRAALGPAAVNQGWRYHLADLVYLLIAWLAGGQAFREWQTHRHHLVQHVLDLVRRDPGRRVQVVVKVRHCHHLRPDLKKYPEVQVVPYSEL